MPRMDSGVQLDCPNFERCGRRRSDDAEFCRVCYMALPRTLQLGLRKKTDRSAFLLTHARSLNYLQERESQ